MVYNFTPRLISWNTTFKCNLRCAHCYIDAQQRVDDRALTTEEGRRLIEQIAEVGKPILILSGGEPLMRDDIFQLARWGTEKGLKVVMGTNGTLITDIIAEKLRKAGISKIAVSLDSANPEKHDRFRGLRGSWEAAVRGIKASLRHGIDLQVNTTVTKDNYGEIEDILNLAQELGASDFHLFFLVPTGRGRELEDLSPVEYEKMIRKLLGKKGGYSFEVKPTCAPQFMRIAKQEGLELKRWGRGCIAGLWYCRIYPTGEVTPCPYLPVEAGNVRRESFKDIWFHSEVFKKLRNFDNLKGKCGVCDYRDICGGCRARAYGLTRDFTDVCGGLRAPTGLEGDYLAEEPWCVYQPKKFR